MRYIYGELQHIRRPGNFRRAVRNIILSIIVLILLLIAAGVTYIALTDKAVVTTLAPTTSVQPNPLLNPTQPSPNAPESAAVQLLTSPTQQDSDASISVKTNATSTCTIKLDYAGAPASETLGTHGTDMYGDVDWTWHVAAGAPLGSWPVTVTCVYRGRSAVVSQNMQVVKR